MERRRTYDTRVKYLVRTGLLPDVYRKQIHRSLISKWKKEDPSKYYGYELNDNIEELYDVLKNVANNQLIQKSVRNIYRINKILKDCVGYGREFTAKLKAHKTIIVKTIQDSKDTIGVNKARKLFGIAKSTFRTWAMEEFFHCNHAITKLCNNAYPQQLTIKEIHKMHRMLVNEKFLHWQKPKSHFLPIKHNYPKIFEGVNSTKVRKATDDKKKITVRTDKYSELKDLWEKLNEKVILEYKFGKESEFKNLFTEFLKAQKGNFTIDGVSERVAKVEIKDDRAIVNEAESIYGRNVATISTMKYSDFLKELSKILNINLATIHQSIIDAGTDINKHLNPTTLRIIKDKFDHFLMANAIDKFSIEYKKVSNNIHPTKLTDEKGNVLSEISASDIGIFFSDEDVAQSYFFDELYYDSELEMKNIKTEINEVIVFTKIPKNSIKIPVAGGKTYSPDFAYVLKFKDGKQKLNFIVETKDVGSDDGLREEEKAKIKHAEKFFGGQVKIEFRKQFSNNKIVDLIRELSIDE